MDTAGGTTTKVKVTMKNERGMVLAMVWLITRSGAGVVRIYSNQQATGAWVVFLEVHHYYGVGRGRRK